MKKFICFILSFSMILTSISFFDKSTEAVGVGSYLMPNAQRVKNYLRTLGNGKYLSGQVGNWHTFTPELPDTYDNTNYVKKVQNSTGYRPAVQTVTYALATELWQHNNSPYWPSPWDWNPTPSNEAMKNIWHNGGIPSAFIVWGNPASYDRGMYGPCDIDLIFAQGTNAVKTNFYRQMDFVAEQMQYLKDYNVPVLFHPFVELDDANKWHASDGVNNAKALHQLVYNYFVNEKDLNNLIWVYYVAYAPHVSTYYPGDEYVDIIGLSQYMSYNTSLESLISDSVWNWMVNKKYSQNKILALPEVGLRQSNEPYADSMKLLYSLENKYSEFSYFSFWKDNWYTTIDNYNSDVLLGHQKIITQNETSHKQMNLSGNFISNPGFESGTNNWLWNSTVNTVTNPVNSGNAAAVVTNRTQVWHGIQQDILNKVNFYGPGKYYVEAYVRNQAWQGNTNAQLSFVLKQNNQWSTHSSLTAVINDYAFTKISGILEFNPSGPLQEAIFKIDTTNSLHNIIVDDISVMWVATESMPLKELASNSSFENGVSPWVGWGSNLSESSNARTGSKSILASRTAWSAMRLDITQLLKNNGDGEYNFSVFAKALNDSNSIYFSLDIDGILSNKGFVATNTSGWTNIKSSYVINNTSSINAAYVYIADANPANGQNNNNYYVDDFSLTKNGICTEIENLAINPSYENGSSPWIGWGSTLSESLLSRTGSKSVLASRTVWSAMKLDITQILKHNGDGDYYFSVFGKAHNDPNFLYFLLDIDGVSVSKGFRYTDAESWTAINSLYTITGTSAINQAFIYIADANPANGQNNNNYFVDDFSIKKYR